MAQEQKHISTAQSKSWTHSNCGATLQNCSGQVSSKQPEQSGANLPGSMCQNDTWAACKADISFTQIYLHCCTDATSRVIDNIFQLFAIYDTITKNKLRYKKEIGVSKKYYHRESLNHKSAVAAL